MIPVMIIEDEFLVRVGLKTSINWEKCGYEVVAEAEDGNEAIEKFKQFLPRLIVTDIRLPKKDGLEVMQEIKELDSNVRFIIISAYDDFEVARKAIAIGVENYFLKGTIDFDEIEDTLENIRKKNNWQKIENNVRGTESLERYPDFNMEQYPEGAYILCARTRNADIEKIVAMLEIIYEEKNIFYQFIKKDNQLIYLIALKEYSIIEIAKITERVFRRYLSEKVYIGISISEKIEKFDWQEKIWEAVLACEHAELENSVEAEFYRESENAYENIKYLVTEFEERFRYNKIGNSRRILEEIFKEFSMRYDVKDFYRLLYKIIGILADVDVDVIEGNIFRDLIETMSYHEILEDLVMWFELYEEKVGNERENHYVILTKEYIRENLSEPLSIGIIADRIHISPNYLGKVFKMNTGEYVTDYITRIRLEKACEILQKRNCSIGKIADMVGIPDSRYFSKLFKKNYGITPKEYMKNI